MFLYSKNNEYYLLQAGKASTSSSSNIHSLSPRSHLAQLMYTIKFGQVYLSYCNSNPCCPHSGFGTIHTCPSQLVCRSSITLSMSLRANHDASSDIFSCSYQSHRRQLHPTAVRDDYIPYLGLSQYIITVTAC